MKKLVIMMILGFMFILGGCTLNQNTGQNGPNNSGPIKTQVPDNKSGNKLGDKATEFTLNDLSGNKVSLSDYKGKKVLLNFWASWCPPCKLEMPLIQKFSAQENSGYTILTVNLGESKDVVEKFLKNNGYTFHTIIDESQEVSDIYMIANIPTSFFIDENGIIRNVHVGVLDEGEAKAFLGIK